MSIALSAFVRESTWPSKSVLWAVKSCGNVFSVTPNGNVNLFPLPHGWRAETVAVSAGRDVWVVAFNQATGKTAVWLCQRKVPQWRLIRQTLQGTEIAGAHVGAWLIEGHRLQRIVQDGSIVQTHIFGFKPISASEGIDGALWVVGGQVRLGGRPLHRCGPTSNVWHELPEPVAAIRVAGAPDGTAWTVNSKGFVWRLHPDGPGHFTECGRVADCRNCLLSSPSDVVVSLSVGPGGEVWCLSSKTEVGGYAVAKLPDFRKKRLVDLPIRVGAVSIAAGQVF